MTAREFQALRYLIDVGGGRAKALRLALFQMRDAREVVGDAGFVLTPEAKARLYDIQQNIIRAAIAADDAAGADGEPLDTTPPERRALATYRSRPAPPLGPVRTAREAIHARFGRQDCDGDPEGGAEHTVRCNELTAWLEADRKSR